MCSHTHISNIKDFEDMCRADISDENIKIYKEVLKELDNWTNNYMTSKKDISNIRKDFIKIYSSILALYKLRSRRTYIVNYRVASLTKKKPL